MTQDEADAIARETMRKMHEAVRRQNKAEALRDMLSGSFSDERTALEREGKSASYVNWNEMKRGVTTDAQVMDRADFALVGQAKRAAALSHQRERREAAGD